MRENIESGMMSRIPTGMTGSLHKNMGEGEILVIRVSGVENKRGTEDKFSFWHTEF